MSPKDRSKFINYPEPLKGPDVPYQNDRKSNPAMRGLPVVIGATLLEWFGFLRSMIWWNAGFGMLRKIQPHLLDYEPRYDPTVWTQDVADLEPDVEDDTISLPVKDPSQLYWTVADYQRMYMSGELTPVAVAKAVLPLIRRDTTPPGAHSMAWFDSKVEQVMRAAEASTQRYKEKKPLGPLDGIPTAVKDEYEIDGYKTCLGSRNDYTSEPSDEQTASWCVQQLEEAGAVILGKLNMHEFGLDTTGNNPIYGTPRNPYNENYYTGGSSSGSGYVVAAGLVPIALGSDGGGSIRIPSSFCGVFGLKPSHGRVSFRPGPNHSVTCAVNGPISSDIRSLATLFDIIATPHPTSHFGAVPRFLASPGADVKRRKLLGIPEVWFNRAAPAVQALCRARIDRLVSDYGYETVSIDFPFLVEGQTAHAMTVLTDGATLLPDTKGLTAGNRILLALGRTTPSTDYLLAQKLRALIMRHLSYLWKENPGMVIVTPTTACAGWPIHGSAELKHGLSDGDRTIQSMEYVWMGNFCGLPGLTVPAGYVVPDGQPRAGEVAGPDVAGKIPVGLMAMGEWTDEESLLHFGLDAEAIGVENRAIPPNWVDVVALAKEEMRKDEELEAANGSAVAT